jgi:hypothetical protein
MIFLTPFTHHPAPELAIPALVIEHWDFLFLCPIGRKIDSKTQKKTQLSHKGFCVFLVLKLKRLVCLRFSHIHSNIL